MDAADQERAIHGDVELPDDVGLPDPRPLVPTMVGVASDTRASNIMNIEATAAALLLGGRVLLSPAAAQGVLAPVLDAERIPWDVQDPSD